MNGPWRARLVIGCTVAGLGVVLWLAVGRNAPEPPAVPAQAMTAPVPRAAPATVAPPRAGPALAARLQASAVASRYLAPTLPAAIRAALARGELVPASRLLAASALPAARAALVALDDFCRSLAATDARLDARRRLAVRVAPGAETLALEALIEAEQLARQRLRQDCASAGLEREPLLAALAAGASGGDAASLERAALDGVLPPDRLRAAALLGAPRAQLQWGLELGATDRAGARDWLKAAADGDAEAAAVYGHCLAAGCGGPPDPAAARRALEDAARRGSTAALGWLASAGDGHAIYHWMAADADFSAVPAADDAAAPPPAQRYGWARLAAALAREGCFGLDLDSAADALGAARRLAAELSPAALQAAEAGAAAVEADAGAALRAARGCADGATP